MEQGTRCRYGSGSDWYPKLTTANNTEGRDTPNNDSVVSGRTEASSPGDEQLTSDEIYNWLPGGLFLLHHWDALPVRKNHID